MPFLELSVSPFGSHTISAEALGSLGLVRYNAHMDCANKRQEATGLTSGYGSWPHVGDGHVGPPGWLDPLPSLLHAEMTPPTLGGGKLLSPREPGVRRGSSRFCLRLPRVCCSQTPNLPFKGFHFLCIVGSLSVPIQWCNKCPDPTPPPSCP